MTTTPNNPSTPDDTGPPPRDDLDAMLRTWHDANAQRAAAGRDRLVRALAEQADDEQHVLRFKDHPAAREPQIASRVAARPSPFALLRSIAVNPYSRLAASLMILVALITLLIPTPGNRAMAQDGFIMVPEGGRLDALDDEGNLIGPCPLKHTDVNVEISGFFSRVTLKQTYHNPYKKKIEAVYTFPMSHRAAVDRMTMTVGDRVVVGEVKERERARQIYEAARAQGYVASLLEQQRPNIFTQSIANIEPEAQVIVEISYVEVLQSKDGQYTFDFPMVVGPRYIPGASMTSPAVVPAELAVRHGVILLGPARLTVGAAGEVTELGSLQTGKLNALLTSAQPIKYPGNTWWGKGDPTGGAGQPTVWYRFEAEYGDGAKEFGELYTDGTGWINGRWFFTDPAAIKQIGTGFSQDTNQVPDASRITPEPVKPGERAGHDISISVTIDTGGPGIVDLKSALHEIKGDDFLDDVEAPNKVTVALADNDEIPNRDFVLSWRTSAETITEAKLTHAGDNGGFFTLILQPPDRIEDADVPPRELIFVMDISGSMSGYPIEKSKEVITKAIDAMRPRDTFNVITFANGTNFLWSDPKSATAENIAAAQSFINSRSGGGGTEMMTAINAALVQTVGEGPTPLTPRQLADLPADGRGVTMLVRCGDIGATLPAEAEGHELIVTIHLGNGVTMLVRGLQMHYHVRPSWQLVTGRWVTQGGRRVFTVDEVRHVDEAAAAKPMRIVLFLTDGYVGNDMAIIGAIKKNAHTTRVFSFGIGNSVNRYLLQGMANAGRGEAEFVLLESDSDAAVERFTKRVETPVLTDITLTFSDGLEVTDVIPPLDSVPDLFDVQPLVIHGRYSQAGKGTLTIAGNTGAGAYERVVDLEFAEDQPEHDVIATLWARAKVEQIMNQDLAAAQANAFPADLKQQVVALGEAFQIMTQYTSFVAVEKSRLTIDGKPVLVAVPIEMPAGVSYEGIFGVLMQEAVGREIHLGAKLGLMSVDTFGSVEGDATDNDDRLLRSMVEVLSKRVQPTGQLDIKLADALVQAERIQVDSGYVLTGSPTAARTPPPGPLPPRASERAVYFRLDTRQRAAGEITGAYKLDRSKPLLYVDEAGQVRPTRGRLEGSRSFKNAPELDLRSALKQHSKSSTAPGAPSGAGGGGGFGGGGFGMGGSGGMPSRRSRPSAPAAVGKSILGDPSDEKKGKNEAEGTITFPWQQSRQLEDAFRGGELRDNTTMFFVDESAPWHMLNLAEHSKELDELKKLAEANKADDQPADAGAVAPSIAPLAAVTETAEESAATELESVETETSEETVELPLLTYLFMRAGRPLLTNEIAILIGQLVEADQIDVAKQLADELVIYLPEYEVGVKMRDAFANTELDDESRNKAVIELALKAQAELEAVMFRAWAEARLRNVLEASL
ncbi:MAG: VWA domain-containing protein, partial [Planctomycetes bacterium]|nr:VWA domain-containing protein [Planctomycetota bacterium]